jgi:hypothetical protein
VGGREAGGGAVTAAVRRRPGAAHCAGDRGGRAEHMLGE